MNYYQKKLMYSWTSKPVFFF